MALPAPSRGGPQRCGRLPPPPLTPPGTPRQLPRRAADRRRHRCSWEEVAGRVRARGGRRDRARRRPGRRDATGPGHDAPPDGRRRARRTRQDPPGAGRRPRDSTPVAPTASRPVCSGRPTSARPRRSSVPSSPSRATTSRRAAQSSTSTPGPGCSRFRSPRGSAPPDRCWRSSATRARAPTRATTRRACPACGWSRPR